jgi:hypothetical protein
MRYPRGHRSQFRNGVRADRMSNDTTTSMNLPPLSGMSTIAVGSAKSFMRSGDTSSASCAASCKTTSHARSPCRRSGGDTLDASLSLSATAAGAPIAWRAGAITMHRLGPVNRLPITIEGLFDNGSLRNRLFSS